LDSFRRLIGKYFINRHLAEDEDGLDLDSDALVFVPGTEGSEKPLASVSRTIGAGRTAGPTTW
jgi:hypothetical protein